MTVGRMSRAAVAEVWSLDPQHQHQLETCWNCRFLGSTPDRLSRKPGGGPSALSTGPQVILMLAQVSDPLGKGGCPAVQGQPVGPRGDLQRLSLAAIGVTRGAWAAA